MLAKYVHGETENRYVASITPIAETPAMARNRISAAACFRRSSDVKIRVRQNAAKRIGRIAPENLELMAAPVARPTATLPRSDGRLMFVQNKYSARVMNAPTGTSVVTSIP